MTAGLPDTGLNLNARAGVLVDRMVMDAAALRVGVGRLAGAVLIDAGINHRGGLEAGRRIAEIGMAGLGQVTLCAGGPFEAWPWQVSVTTSQPVLACLASQYAGWSLKVDDGGSGFFALGSGPARALAGSEALFDDLDHTEKADRAVLVVETDRLPPAALAVKVASDCGVDPGDLAVVLTPTGSLAGVMQIAARVVEVGLHKAHELGFPLGDIVDACGTTPVPPPVADGLAAMGRTNDTILFGGDVHLFVTGPDGPARQLAEDLPSSNSRDYGKPFAEVFRSFDFDFFKIDGMLFSPARVAVTAVESGRTFRAGRLDPELLRQSFGLDR